MDAEQNPILKFIGKIKISSLLIVIISLSGCTISAISPDVDNVDVPEYWSSTTEAGGVSQNWLDDFADGQLIALVNDAITNNHQLAEQKARLDEAREAVIISGAAQYPEIRLGFDASRRQTIISDSTRSLSSNFELGLDLAWEVDLLGKLSDAEKQAMLSLYSAEAQLKNSSHKLAADVSSALYNAIANKELLELFSQRFKNLQDNLEIITQSYEQGINNALDIYLSRDTVEQESSRVAEQKQTLNESIIAMQLLLARYPDGKLAIHQNLPLIESVIQPGLPSELLKRRPDIQQAWYELLAADTALAIAHKNRFPSLSLVAASSDVSDELGSLLNGSRLAWSLIGSLTQPIFNAGRLKATEEQTRTRVIQAEKRYLDKLLLAFSEVETAISNHYSLVESYNSTLASEENAVIAYTLSFEQYQRGLVTFTTVLESQRRAFDAQSSVIELRNQLIQNRIALYLALGGDFSQQVVEESRKDLTE